MQNQPHRRPALKTLTVCVRPGGVTQLDWGRHWTFTAALGKCALEESSQCSVTHTKSMLTHYAHCSLKREQELKMAYLCPHISHHSSSTSRVGCKQNTRPTIQLSRRSHLYFCKCMVVDWLWLAASWNWAPAFKLIFVFFLHQRQCSLNTIPRVGWAQIPMDSKNFTPLCAFMDVRSCFEKVNGCFEHSTF